MSESASAGSPTTLVTVGSSRPSLCRRIEAKWDEIQVGRQGSYSVERLESLHLYCKSTSQTRAVLVCLVTPLPALFVAVILECLPLRPPSDGWAANWVFWLRLLLTQVILGTVGNSQIVGFVPGLEFPFTKKLAIAAGVAISLVGTFILVATKAGFPVPCMMQLAPIPIGIYMLILTRLILGPALFAKDSPFKLRFDRYNRYFLAFMTLVSIYPFYKTLYGLIPSRYQGVTIVILPVWKFAAKRFLVGATRDFEDVMPVIVAFSVDFMSTLFISVCISTSGSLLFSLLFIASDLAQMLLEFRELCENAKVLSQILDDHRQSQDAHSGTEGTDLLTVLLDTTRNSSAFQGAQLEGVRLWACLPHPLTLEQNELLHRLEVSNLYPRQIEAFARTNSLFTRQANSRWLTTQRASISPTPGHIHASKDRPSARIKVDQAHLAATSAAESRDLIRSKILVVQGLSLLFHCEYMALVEYVECIVPMIFVIFKSILEQLPNIVYYPGGAGNWSGKIALGILAFAVMELGSLFCLHVFLKRKFAFSPLYLIAFVFETEMYPTQAILFANTLNVLQYEIFHLGADFTFRFEWLQDKSQ